MGEDQADRRQLQKQRIIDATWRVVASGGFESLTMRELANELGLAHGAVKYYFASKDALLEAALERVLVRSRERVFASIAGSRGLVTLRRFLIDVMPLLDDTRTAAAVVVASWGRATGSNVYRQQLAENNLRWRQLLRAAAQEAADHGELTEHAPAPEQVGDLIATLMAGSQPLSFLLPDETAPARLIAMIDSYLDVIASPDGRAALERERARTAGHFDGE